MKMFSLMPALLLSWPMLKVAKKGWRLSAVLFLASLITGCASTSNKLDESPCACEFKNLNTGNYRSKADA